MRAVVLWFMATVLVAAAPAGCSKPGASATRLGSDLGLRLAWPGPPSESRTSTTGPGGEVQAYIATYTSKAPGRFLLFVATVTDFGPAAANEMTPQELLDASKFAFRKDELSRKEIEHGPKKFPGLDILSQRDGKVSREVVVAVGPRLYSVSVTASTEELLGAPEVTAFFDSFAIEK